MSRNRFIALSILFDAIAFNAAVIAAFELRFLLRVPPVNFAPYLVLWPYLTVAFLISAYVYGLYDPERVEGFWQVAQGAAAGSTLTLLLTLGILYLSGIAFNAFPRPVVLIAWPLQLLLPLGWRALATRVTPIRWPVQRVLVVGTGALAVELAGELHRREKWGYRVVGLPARRVAARAGHRARADAARP
jgi:FlaA1/EpsC-like NDP-sugar epimerase